MPLVADFGSVIVDDGTLPPLPSAFAAFATTSISLASSAIICLRRENVVVVVVISRVASLTHGRVPKKEGVALEPLASTRNWTQLPVVSSSEPRCFPNLDAVLPRAAAAKTRLSKGRTRPIITRREWASLQRFSARFSKRSSMNEYGWNGGGGKGTRSSSFIL